MYKFNILSPEAYPEVVEKSLDGLPLNLRSWFLVKKFINIDSYNLKVILIGKYPTMIS